MPCPREHIDRSHLRRCVSDLRKSCAVACGGSAIAGNHHDTAGRHFLHRGDDFLAATLARWVNHDNVGTDTVLGELFCGFTCVGADKFCVGYAVFQRVFLCVFHSRGDNLDTDELACLICHGKADRADTAVKVKENVMFGKLSEIGGGLIKNLRAVVVYLIEGEGEISKESPQSVSVMPSLP